MQWPMVLVYHPEKQKVYSVSRKKIVCHDGAYANFEPTRTNIPNARIAEIEPRPDPQEQETPINAPTPEDPKIEGVHSIKILR